MTDSEDIIHKKVIRVHCHMAPLSDGAFYVPVFTQIPVVSLAKPASQVQVSFPSTMPQCPLVHEPVKLKHSNFSTFPERKKGLRKISTQASP